MSILIKGMEMPQMCTECEIRDEEENYWGEIVSLTCPIIRKNVEDYGWRGKRKRHEDCPLVEVPEPHGRLIDADKLLKRKGDAYDSNGHLLYAVGTGSIVNAPTVIDAEEQDHD